MDRKVGGLQSMRSKNQTQMKWLSMHAECYKLSILETQSKISPKKIYGLKYAHEQIWTDNKKIKKNRWINSLNVNVSCSVVCVWLFVTPLTVTHQAPLSMGFPRQEYWSWLPFPSPGNLPDPGIEPRSPTLQADSLLAEPLGESQLTHSCA